MKNLMITTAAAALLMGAAACSQAADDIELGEANYGESQSAEAANETDPSNAEMASNEAGQAEVNGNLMDADPEMAPRDAGITYLADSELSAGNLIGAKVTGATGEDIATVDDLLINAGGEVESVIFRSGDFIDIVGTKGALPYSAVDLTMAADADPRFSVGMTEEAIQEVAEFEQDGLNDYRLASEIMGTTAAFVNSNDSVRIRDIILSQDGTVQYAVISDPLMLDDMRTIGFDRIQVEQGDGGLVVVDAAKADLTSMPRFAYEAETSAEASLQGESGGQDSSDDDGLMPDMDGSGDTSTPQ